MSLRTVLYTAVVATAIATGLSFGPFQALEEEAQLSVDTRSERLPASTQERVPLDTVVQAQTSHTIHEALQTLSEKDFAHVSQYEQFVAAVESGLILPEEVDEALEYYQMINEHEEIEMTDFYDEYE